MDPVLHTTSQHSLPGTWFHDDGREVRVGASIQSFSAAAKVGGGTLAMTAFVTYIGYGFLTALAGLPSPPLWPTSMVSHGGLHTVLVFPLAIVGGLVLVPNLAWESLVLLCGRTEVTFRPERCEWFRGIGPFGKRRRFDPALVTAVVLEQLLPPGTPGTPAPKKSPSILIKIKDRRDIQMGKELSPEKRAFLLEALTAALQKSRARV